MKLSIDDAVQEGDEAAAEGAVWAHLLPAAKRPPMLPALERLLLVPDAHDARGSLDACQQQVQQLRHRAAVVQLNCLQYTESSLGLRQCRCIY